MDSYLDYLELISIAFNLLSKVIALNGSDGYDYHGESISIVCH